MPSLVCNTGVSNKARKEFHFPKVNFLSRVRYGTILKVKTINNESNREISESIPDEITNTVITVSRNGGHLKHNTSS